mgnify:FL=1|tara:strand:- start:313 stop:780 length:468 start_codon:yes stop_codon:yes gene_type:complete
MFVCHETKENFDNEQTLADFLAKQWNCTMQRQRKYAQFDFVALKGKEIKAYVEMRERKIPHDKYPNCYINAGKLLTAKSLTDLFNIPCLFAVSWSDRIGYVNLNQKFKMEFSAQYWGTRTDPTDVEAIGLIPISSFTFFKQKKPPTEQPKAQVGG